MSFKPSVITMALLAAGVSVSAYAAEDQTAAQAEQAVEVIQVKGIRASMAASQMEKMSNTSIVEAVSAEDIGKLPDVSIAESLARLPGVTAQRLDGRANVISIRGLAPDFTTATLNGREQVTISDNRGVELDQYPSELLNGAVVYKTPDAGVLAQAIGGTVDMRTVRPLAHGEQALVVNLKGEQNDMGALNPDGTDKGYRGSISYIDQFADDTIGIALGYARMKSPNQEERMHIWGYPEVCSEGDANDGKCERDDRTIMGGAKPYVRSSVLERDGFMGVFEFKPNDKFHSVLDVFYSKFDDEQILRGVEIPGAHWGNGSGNNGFEVINSRNGVVTEGVLKNQKLMLRNDITETKSDVLSVGWNNAYEINDKWSVELDIAHSKADRRKWAFESYASSSRNAQDGCANDPMCLDLGFKMTDRGPVFIPHPNLELDNPAYIGLGGPYNWGNNAVPLGQDGFINEGTTKDELSSARFSTTYTTDNSFISAVRVGLNYSERSKVKDYTGTYLAVNEDKLGARGVTPNAIPTQYLLDPTNLGFIGLGNMLSYDSRALLRDGYYTGINAADVELGRSVENWGVTEKVTTAFVKADIDSEIAGRPLLGNVGVQVVHTDQSSDGIRSNINDGKVVKQNVTDGTNYTELLPSLNLSYQVIDGHQIRLAAARTLARARMDQMKASSDVNYDAEKSNSTDIENSPWSANSGNPHLKPWMAWQYDLGYEVYFGSSYVAVGAFYKQLENHVYSQQVIGDFSDITVPDPQPNMREGYVNTYANGEGGYIRGLEFSAHLNGELLHDALEPFGLIINGAYNQSKVRETKDSDPIALPGLSEKTANATVYYENAGFQARVSARYRSDFLGEVSGVSLARDMRFVKGETLVDAQIGYDFSESGIDALYGLTVYLQGTNLTNQEFVTYENHPSQIKDYQLYGRNFMLGVSYTF
ncbi:TonB-dependent receptor [Paraferrimonas sedimenticola]|uniref:TonB-dependent receptor n=1 Tax=Paraferrimonas sedimenticola TaxID=375674 RepID=A0AA37RVV7_9GAMM|nr:TonB-dependent receptor [Paraferrimonas sedimenticola]GLP95853.1 TonB-dependent receptor [Paraferrimonas sedimenticola]